MPRDKGGHAILPPMSLADALRAPSTNGLRTIFGAFFRPYRAALVGILAMALGIAFLGAVEPLLLKLVFDAFSEGAGDVARALLLVAVLVGALLVREAVASVLDFWTWK